jgi:RND family efflux transporter MFP subunit
VLARNVEVGSLVAAGTVGVTVGDISWLKLVFSVADLEVDKLKVGRNLGVRFDALPGRSFQGRISAIAAAADPKSRVFDVEIALANAGRLIKPGMIGSVTLEPSHDRKDVVVVPLSALVRSKKTPGGFDVFVLEADAKDTVARLREVELGPAIGNQMSVRQGVKVGEKIVVSGAQLITDGDPVTVVP